MGAWFCLTEWAQSISILEVFGATACQLGDSCSKSDWQDGPEIIAWAGPWLRIENDSDKPNKQILKKHKYMYSNYNVPISNRVNAILWGVYRAPIDWQSLISLLNIPYNFWQTQRSFSLSLSPGLFNMIRGASCLYWLSSVIVVHRVPKWLTRLFYTYIDICTAAASTSTTLPLSSIITEKKPPSCSSSLSAFVNQPSNLPHTSLKDGLAEIWPKKQQSNMLSLSWKRTRRCYDLLTSRAPILMPGKPTYQRWRASWRRDWAL